MAIGIVSNDEFDKEFNSGLSKSDKSDKVITPELIISPLPTRGRNSKPDTPEVIRNIVGEEGIKGASISSLMNDFALSQASVSAYKNGAVSTASYDTPNEKLANHLGKVKDKIKRRATNKLMQSLDVITPEKLAELKPNQASQVAKDMAVIVRTMEPDSSSNGDGKTPFVVFAPQIKIESDYPVIKVNEP